MTQPTEIEPYAASIAISFPHPVTDAKLLIGELLELVGKRCVAAGATLIGHIKCYGELPNGEFFHCSLTSLRSGAVCGGDASMLASAIKVDLNVLVYGLSRETIDHIVRQSLQHLAITNKAEFDLVISERHRPHLH